MNNAFRSLWVGKVIGAALLAALVTLACGAQPRAFPDPGSAQWTRLAGGLDRPTDIRSTGSSLLVTQRKGLLVRYQDGQFQPEPVLDLSSRIDASRGEKGLLGLALDPGFEQNRYFYVYYTDQHSATVLERFSLADGDDRVDPLSGVMLLSIDQPFTNHNGGALAFGPDGYLYIGVGDGGSNGDPRGYAQRLDNLLGKVLRIDVSGPAGYRIPRDNPFRETLGAHSEIWAYGLRNPWRISFDPPTNSLFIADVGESRYEEVNRQDARLGGLNYGWNAREGRHLFEASAQARDFTEPVAEYGHSLGCAVTGGYTVHDPRLPEWAGIYLYGDSCSGRIWGLLEVRPGRWRSQLLFTTGFSITSFGRDSSGRVYLVDYGSGDLYRLDPSGVNGSAQNE